MSQIKLLPLLTISRMPHYPIVHMFVYIPSHCCEILKYLQVYKPYRSIVEQERGRTHRDLYERRKIN